MKPLLVRSSKLTLAVTLIAVLYWIVIAVFTHLPSGLIPVRFFNVFDKFQHFTAFLGLAVLLCAVWTNLGASTFRMLVTVLLILAAYGVLDELTQSFIPGRTPDLYDWVADMLGSIAGAGAFGVIRECLRGHDCPVTN